MATFYELFYISPLIFINRFAGDVLQEILVLIVLDIYIWKVIDIYMKGVTLCD